ncbi:MAG: PH domain-containing protein [Muribaculaceae bacterium]|nr:PH domain-containing protein [Muribaculaceae bacterium]
MKKKVELSLLSVTLTIVSFIVLVGIFLFEYSRSEHEAIVWWLFAIVVIWAGFCLFYAPLYIELGDTHLIVARSIRLKEIPLEDIASVALCPPTMAERRLCGSGGCFGHWGWYMEADLGRYFAYYGKASDCFLVTLRDGRRYMLGCKDAPEMVAAIRKRLGLPEA